MHRSLICEAWAASPAASCHALAGRAVLVKRAPGPHLVRLERDSACRLVARDGARDARPRRVIPHALLHALLLTQNGPASGSAAARGRTRRGGRGGGLNAAGEHDVAGGEDALARARGEDGADTAQPEQRGDAVDAVKVRWEERARGSRVTGTQRTQDAPDEAARGAACPVRTGWGTRRVCLVRGEG
jgi:hypothetical protein